ncbi:MAG: hypothetical protein PHH60_01795 [Candidatus Margulisbacteria bacterium]|nr:hypothetical protein [Candidatus Margulisiibacteriota bacterium]
MHFENSDYDLWIIPNSGSSIDLNDGSSHLQDIKGYPVGSPFTDASTTIEVGLWGLISVTGEAPYVPPTVEVVDTGKIRDTKIFVEGENIKLTWGFDAGGPVPVKIYCRMGPASEYAAEAATFAPVITVPDPIPATTTEYVFPNFAHNGINQYYRVVPATLIGPDVLSPLDNSITVGKVEVNCPKGLYVFACLPFQEDNFSLKNLIGDQLGDSAEYDWWNGDAYEIGTYTTAASWSKDKSLRIGEGFLLRAVQADKKVALVGRFGSVDPPATRELIGHKYNLIGYPYPQITSLFSMGITPSDSDEIDRWIVYVDAANKQYYNIGTYNGVSGNWTVAPGVVDIDKMALAEPRFYRPMSGSIWTITFP